MQPRALSGLSLLRPATLEQVVAALIEPRADLVDPLLVVAGTHDPSLPSRRVLPDGRRPLVAADTVLSVAEQNA